MPNILEVKEIGKKMSTLEVILVDIQARLANMEASKTITVRPQSGLRFCPSRTVNTLSNRPLS